MTGTDGTAYRANGCILEDCARRWWQATIRRLRQIAAFLQLRQTRRQPSTSAIHRFGAFVSELQCRCWILMYRAGGRRSCREAAAAGNRCDRRALWRVLKDSLLLPKGMSCDESKPVRSRFACRRDPLTQKAAVMI